MDAGVTFGSTLGGEIHVGFTKKLKKVKMAATDALRVGGPFRHWASQGRDAPVPAAGMSVAPLARS
ncbi:hypothetical protein [Bradyrhizobium sp. USDA 4354]